MIDLRVWPGQVADGNENSVTPGKGPKGNKMYRLTKVRLLIITPTQRFELCSV